MDSYSYKLKASVEANLLKFLHLIWLTDSFMNWDLQCEEEQDVVAVIQPLGAKF